MHDIQELVTSRKAWLYDRDWAFRSELKTEIYAITSSKHIV